MARWSFSDAEIQSRMSDLAQILMRQMHFAKHLVADSPGLGYSQSSVYRMFGGDGEAPAQPWSEPVARRVVELLESRGLCRPELWKRLFEPADLPELKTEKSPPTVRAPNPTFIREFQDGVLRPAEGASRVIHLIAGRLPLQLVTLPLRRMVMPNWDAFPVPLRRGITVWGNGDRKELLKRRKDMENDRRRKIRDRSATERDTPTIAPQNKTVARRQVFLLELAVKEALDFLKAADPSIRQRQSRSFLQRITELVHNDMGLSLCLVDGAKLSTEDMNLLHNKLHVIVGSLSNPSLRLQWPMANYDLYYWQAVAGSPLPILTEAEKRAFKRIESTLTHTVGDDDVLDRISHLAYESDMEI